MNSQAAEFARQHHLAGTVGSDAHTLGELGQATLLLPPFSSAEDLKTVIWDGQQQVKLSPFWVHFYSSLARLRKRLNPRLNEL